MKTSNILLSCLLAVIMAFPLIMILGLRTKLNGHEYKIIKPDVMSRERVDTIALHGY
jgi:hypothetical protein